VFVRILVESIRRRAKSRLAALLSIALGAGAASGLVMLLLGVGDRVAEELRRNDANIEIVAASGDLDERSLPGLKLDTNRWRNQLRFLIPELRFEKAGYAVTGRELDPRWKLEGRPGVVAGVSLCLAPGATVNLGRPLTVTGVVSTGGEEDTRILLPLKLAQELAGKPGKLSRVLVSAVVTPDTDEFKRFQKGGGKFSDAERERMMCVPFAVNVARDYGEALEAEARVIREVAENEGALLGKIRGVVGILALAAIVAACLSVLAAMTASVVDRRKEVGLLKALGATNGTVAGLFVGEALLLAVAGSLLGYGIGLVSAKAMSVELFGAAVPGSGVVYIVTLAAALGIAALGTAWPLRRVAALQPQQVLHEV